ncbi:MAG: glutathione-disulfide reductase [Alphaproteobacteria bacterium]|nr:glutathione-disulfide reductase [Alphaproteobacteria bacterium]
MSSHGFDYDLFVIGCGSGGARAARIASRHGAKVALAEKQYYGGTCVNVGCVPKKMMTYLSGFNSSFKDARGYGWNVGETLLDWKHFIDKKNLHIKKSNDFLKGGQEKAGVTIYWGAAYFKNNHTLHIDGKDVTANKIIIATGGKPFIPDIKGAKEYGITSDDVFYLEKQPKRIVINGVGYIGLEFAGIFNELGSEVHVIYRRDRILNEGFDSEIRDILQEEMRKKGIHFHPFTNITEVYKTENAYGVSLDNGEKIEADKVLFSTGRAPDVDSLELDAAGVVLNRKGAIAVNKDDQTNVPNIYAIGDVTDRVALTPVAIREGHALVDRLFGNKPNRYLSYDNIPSAIFSTPNASQVGLTEEQALEKFGKEDIDIYTTNFRGLKMALADNQERTFMKLVVQKSTDKVLGVHMVGADAGEIIQGFATALIAGAKKSHFDNTVAIHPVAAEEFVTMREKTR